jgi:hypothetical protein
VKRLFLIWLAAGFCTATALAAGPAAPPDGELAWTRRPVPFSHSAHAAASVDCASCHHPGADQQPYQPCAAAGCHDNLNSRDTSLRSYYLATHQNENPERHSCVSCHAGRAGDDPPEQKRLAGCRGSVCHP